MTVLAAKTLLVADAADKCAPGLPASFCHHHATTGCVGGNGLFCAGWAADNFDRYVGPFFRHLEIVAISVVAGFVIALGLALLSHRHRALVPPVLGATGRPLHDARASRSSSCCCRSRASDCGRP